MLEPFPDLVPALGTIFFRIMGEGLTSGTPKDRLDKLEAVRQSLLAAWPDEIEQSRAKTRMVPVESGGVRAMFVKD